MAWHFHAINENGDLFACEKTGCVMVKINISLEARFAITIVLKEDRKDVCMECSACASQTWNAIVEALAAIFEPEYPQIFIEECGGLLDFYA